MPKLIELLSTTLLLISFPIILEQGEDGEFIYASSLTCAQSGSGSGGDDDDDKKNDFSQVAANGAPSRTSHR